MAHNLFDWTAACDTADLNLAPLGGAVGSRRTPATTRPLRLAAGSTRKTGCNVTSGQCVHCGRRVATSTKRELRTVAMPAVHDVAQEVRTKDASRQWTTPSPPDHMENRSAALVIGAVHIGVAETRGHRPAMEDTVIVSAPPTAADPLVLGVCDGHGGATVSRWLCDHLPNLILQRVRRTVDVRRALRDAFGDAHDALVEAHSAEQIANTGSTACVLLVLPQTQQYYVANCGDSRAIAVHSTTQSSDGEVVQTERLSEDHKPDLLREQQRIASCGGFVTRFTGVARLNGALSVSRSFGDVEHRALGMTEEPDVYGPFTARDTVIIGCDGLYDVLTDDEVGAVAEQFANDPRSAAEQLRNVAFQRNSRDNITAMVVRFTAPPPSD